MGTLKLQLKEILKQMHFLQTYGVDIVKIAFMVIGIASIIAKMTPSEADNKVIDKAIKFVNTVALNPLVPQAMKDELKQIENEIYPPAPQPTQEVAQVENPKPE